MEARLIRAYAPPFSRAQRGRGSAWWLSLTDERFPRLSRVRKPKGPALGPLSARQAEVVKEAIEEASLLRSCTDRIGVRPTRSGSCVRGQTGMCAAPCVDPSVGSLYEPAVEVARSALETDPSAALRALERRMDALGQKQLFEQAATTRDRVEALVRSLVVARRLGALATAGCLEVAIGPNRLRIVDGVLDAVDGVPLAVVADGHHDEPRLIASWLARNTHRVRVVSASGAFASPRAGGAALRAWEDRLRSAAATS